MNQRMILSALAVALASSVTRAIGAAWGKLFHGTLTGGRVANPGFETKWFVKSAAVGFIVLMAGTSTSSSSSDPDVRREAVSRQAFETMLPVLQGLKPNDSLQPLKAHMKTYKVPSDPRSPPIVVMPGWINSLSGGTVGGIFLLGSVSARSGDKICGTHVFGYIEQEKVLTLRFLILTEATLITEQEWSQLEATHTEGVGVTVAPGSRLKLYFRDLHVKGTRELTSVEDPEHGSVTIKPGKRGDAVEWYFSKQSFEAMEEKLRSLAPGTDFWDALYKLGAMFTTNDFGETHTLAIRAYVSSDRFPTRFHTGEDGVYSLWPFGYGEDKREMPQLVLVFKNGHLLRVAPFAGDWKVETYIHD